VSTSSERLARIDDPWLAGGVAGVLAGAGMAVLLTVVTPPTLFGAIPALYGLSGPIPGWLVHLTHGGLFGVLFAGLTPGVDSRRGVILVAVGFAVVLWFVGAGAIMPIWLQSIGFPGASELTVPNLRVPIFAAHLVYGVVLGTAFAVVVDVED
jgi:hypothetical protein